MSKSDDTISRQDAIEAIESRQTEQWMESDIDYNSGLESALCEIKALPSAEARPTGEWVDDCTCSICHWMHEDNNGFALITKYNYCPNCGCKMQI